MQAHNGEARSSDGGAVLAGAWVVVRDGLIAAVGRGLPPPGAETSQDLAGAWLVPGFADLHVHGGGGAWLSSTDPEELGRAVRFHLDHGTTTLLASLATSPLDRMAASAAAV